MTTLTSSHAVSAQDGFAKAHADTGFLLTCFGEVLEELGEGELAAALPWREQRIPVNTDSLPMNGLAQVHSIAFQLLSLVEENVAAQSRRFTEAAQGIIYNEGLWGNVLNELRSIGLEESEAAAVLAEVHVEPVLTAHPTEAKRATVLEHYRDLYLLLVRRDRSGTSCVSNNG